MNSRQTHILEALAATREASVLQLAEQFGVSEMTIRRDLAVLAERGQLTRTYGGALLSKAGVIEFTFKERGEQQVAAKKAIAAAVARLIHPGMTLSLDTGTTTLEIANAIVAITPLTVLTSSLAIASTLYAHEHIELVLLGGVARKGSPDLTGWLTEENLKRFRVDLAILGADAADRHGVYTTDVGVARVSQTMMAGAKQTLLAVDHTKFDNTSFVQYASWQDIDHVITDAAVPAATRKWLKKVAKCITWAKA